MRAKLTGFCELADLLGGVGAPDAVVGAEELGGFVEHGVRDLSSVVFFEEAGLHVRGLISYAVCRLMDVISSELGVCGEEQVFLQIKDQVLESLNV